MTRQEEQRIMDGFRNAYASFPAGNLVAHKPPYPDFVLTTADNRQIGIELTEVFHSNDAKEQSAFKDRITNAVVLALTQRLPYPFTMNIFLDYRRSIRLAKMDKLTEELTNLCLIEFWDLKHDQWGQVEHIELDLSSILPNEANWIRQ